MRANPGILFLMLLWITILILLQGCQGMPAFFAGGSQTVAAGTSSYETYKTITMVKVGVDAALTADGKKTTTDVVLSRVTGKDCKVMRSVRTRTIKYMCIEVMPENLGQGEIHELE
tara:strand:- start:406 stop:753 length:348 start_codon:yes stop_codon:yes gene_type:complete